MAKLFFLRLGFFALLTKAASRAEAKNRASRGALRKTTAQHTRTSCCALNPRPPPETSVSTSTSRADNQKPHALSLHSSAKNPSGSNAWWAKKREKERDTCLSAWRPRRLDPREVWNSTPVGRFRRGMRRLRATAAASRQPPKKERLFFASSLRVDLPESAGASQGRVGCAGPLPSLPPATTALQESLALPPSPSKAKLPLQRRLRRWRDRESASPKLPRARRSRVSRENR